MSVVHWSWKPHTTTTATRGRDAGDDDQVVKRSPRYPPRQQQLQKPIASECHETEPDIDEAVLSNVRSQSLFLDMEQWSRPLMGSATADNDRFQRENKREGAYALMAEREMLPQVNQNPFLASHSFVDDLAAQTEFLKASSDT